MKVVVAYLGESLAMSSPSRKGVESSALHAQPAGDLKIGRTTVKRGTTADAARSKRRPFRGGLSDRSEI